MSPRVSAFVAVILCACTGSGPEPENRASLRENAGRCPLVQLQETRTVIVTAAGERVSEEIVVCKQCLSETKEPIGERSCTARDPAPGTPGTGDVQCDKRVEADGRVCWRCVDAAGQVVKEGCEPAPDPNNTPPPGDVKCDRYTRDDGTVCYRCIDAAGQVVKEGCEPAPDPNNTPPPGDVKCDRYTRDDGTVCYRCIDASGQVVKEVCPAP